MLQCTGFEPRHARKSIEGWNPSLAAILQPFPRSSEAERTAVNRDVEVSKSSGGANQEGHYLPPDGVGAAGGCPRATRCESCHRRAFLGHPECDGSLVVRQQAVILCGVSPTRVRSSSVAPFFTRAHSSIWLERWTENP